MESPLPIPVERAIRKLGLKGQHQPVSLTIDKYRKSV